MLSLTKCQVQIDFLLTEHEGCTNIILNFLDFFFLLYFRVYGHGNKVTQCGRGNRVFVGQCQVFHKFNIIKSYCLKNDHKLNTTFP